MATVANVYSITDRAAMPNLRAIVRDMLARRRERQRILRELRGHTDRELADMGITRNDIQAVAHGTYRR